MNTIFSCSKRARIILVILIYLPFYGFSQSVSYTFDGKSHSFKTVYKSELTKNESEIYLYFLEQKLPDLDKIQDGELIHHPEAMSISIKGLKEEFPVKQKLELKHTFFEREMSEYKQSSAIANKASKALKTSQPIIEKEIKKREEKMKQLTKKIQNGDMAAMEELQKISEELQSIINGEMDKLPLEEVELKNQYFEILINMPTDDSSRWNDIIPVSGVFTIFQLDDKSFKAKFEGMGIYESGNIKDTKPLVITWDLPLKSS